VPAQVRGPHLAPVARPPPAGDHDAGLLPHLAGQPVEQRLALVDHAARRAPVVVAVAPAVAHEEEPVPAEDQAASHQPLTHRPSLAPPGPRPGARRVRRPARPPLRWPGHARGPRRPPRGRRAPPPRRRPPAAPRAPAARPGAGPRAQPPRLPVAAPPRPGARPPAP